MKGQSYNLKDLIMRCNLNEPFCGAIDDGKGTIVYVNTELFTNEYSDGGCLYYEKRIMLRIDKVTHIVKKGDSLYAIAKKLNISVDAIVKSNGIKDENLIKTGDVLDINVDIRYGYQVNSMVDTLCFLPQAQEYGYNPLSETVLYKIIDQANSVVDNLGTSLVQNSGKSRYRIGNGKIRLYYEKPSGNVFRGNQYGKTMALKDVGGKLLDWTQPGTIINNPFKTTNPLSPGKVAIPLAVILEGVEIYDGWEQDGRTFGYNTQKQMVGATYGLAGAALGAKIGFWAGGILSFYFGGVGAVPGTIIGGFLGGFWGGLYTEDKAESIYESITIK